MKITINKRKLKIFITLIFCRKYENWKKGVYKGFSEVWGQKAIKTKNNNSAKLKMQKGLTAHKNKTERSNRQRGLKERKED